MSTSIRRGDCSPSGTLTLHSCAGAIVVFLIIAFVFIGLVGPIAEELYLRGYLLLRIDCYGIWAAVLNNSLFSIYHVWTPWRWPQIIVGFLPLTLAVWRTRSIEMKVSR